MELHYAQAFLVFATSPNMAIAAKKLGLTQPAVSIQLQKFQGQYAQPLFAQQGKKKVLTTFGREVLAVLEPGLEGLSKDLDAVNQRFLDPEKQQYFIGGRAEIIRRVASKTIYPGKLIFRDMVSADAVRALENNEVDIAFSNVRSKVSYIISRRLFTEAFYLVVPKILCKDPDSVTLAKIKRLEVFRELPFISYHEKFNHLPASVATYFSLPFKYWHLSRICADWHVIREMVESGVGVSIVPGGFIPDPERCLSFLLPQECIPKDTFYIQYRPEMKGHPIITDMVAGADG